MLQTNGISETFSDIFTKWSLANYIDDTNFLSGEYGYTALTLPTFTHAASYTGLPVNTDKTLNKAASEYYKLPIIFTELNASITVSNPDN